MWQMQVSSMTVVNLPPGSATPAVHLELRIFWRIFELKIRNGANVITGGPHGKMILGKKPERQNLATMSLE
jgi:hypothetical protein